MLPKDATICVSEQLRDVDGNLVLTHNVKPCFVSAGDDFLITVRPFEIPSVLNQNGYRRAITIECDPCDALDNVTIALSAARLPREPDWQYPQPWWDKDTDDDDGCCCDDDWDGG